MGQSSFATALAHRTQTSGLGYVLLPATALWLVPLSAPAQTIDVAIGHQSMCTDT